MMRRSGLVAVVATLAAVAPAAATPVGEPAPVAPSENLGLLYNPVADAYVVLSSVLGLPDFSGYLATAVSREGPITAQSLFTENFPAFSDPILAHDSDRNRYLVLAGSDDPSLQGFLYSGDGSRLQRVTLDGASGGAYAAVYNSARGEYLVAFPTAMGASRTTLMVQRLDADGTAMGGPTAVSDRPEVTAIGSADIAYRGRFNDYLVVWDGQRTDGSTDVYAQRLGAKGRELGREDIQVSRHRNAVGQDANVSPAVAQGDGDALVVWLDGYTVYGRRLVGRSVRPGKAQIPYSSTGPAGTRGYPAGAPVLGFHSTAREYLVVWPAEVHRTWAGGFESDVSVIFGQHVRRNGRPRGPQRFEISPSDLPDPDVAFRPAVAAAPGDNYLVTWQLHPTCCTRSSMIYARRIAPRRYSPHRGG